MFMYLFQNFVNGSEYDLKISFFTNILGGRYRCKKRLALVVITHDFLIIPFGYALSSIENIYMSMLMYFTCMYFQCIFMYFQCLLCGSLLIGLLSSESLVL